MRRNLVTAAGGLVVVVAGVVAWQVQSPSATGTPSSVSDEVANAPVPTVPAEASGPIDLVALPREADLPLPALLIDPFAHDVAVRPTLPHDELPLLPDGIAADEGMAVLDAVWGVVEHQESRSPTYALDAEHAYRMISEALARWPEVERAEELHRRQLVCAERFLTDEGLVAELWAFAERSVDAASADPIAVAVRYAEEAWLRRDDRSFIPYAKAIIARAPERRDVGLLAVRLGLTHDRLNEVDQAQVTLATAGEHPDPQVRREAMRASLALHQRLGKPLAVLEVASRLLRQAQDDDERAWSLWALAEAEAQTERYIAALEHAHALRGMQGGGNAHRADDLVARLKRDVLDSFAVR